MLRRMQAMARIQARASSNRAYTSSNSCSKTSKIVNSSAASHQYYYPARPWNSNSADERSDKILEIDTWKPFPTTSRYFSAWNKEYSKSRPNPSIHSEDIVSSVIFPKAGDHQVAEAWMAKNNNNSPTRSECSRRSLFFGEYLGHPPSFMAYTESSRAKVRSQSAPKQRLMELKELSKFGPSFWESDAISDKGSPLRSNLKRQGPPTRGSGLASCIFSNSYYPNS